MVKFAAVTSTLSILGFMIVWLLDAPKALVLTLFVVALVSVVILLCRAYVLVSIVEKMEEGWGRYKMRGHILLHLIPFSYLIMRFFTEVTLREDLLYLVPVMLFFLTGRQMWKAAYVRFQRKIYRIFIAGNTALLIWCPILVGLELLNKKAFENMVFYHALLGYFLIHLLITGAIVVKVEKDILADTAEPAFHAR